MGRFWVGMPRRTELFDRDLECTSLARKVFRDCATRGLATIAIFGNIVTAWSWFGTNMLGVGLHSYGFMDKAFNSLMGFILSQLAIIALAYVPASVKMLINLGGKLLSNSPPKQTETGA